MKKRKVALVTGGAKRLGKAICLSLAGNDYDVAFTYLTSIKESVATENEIKSLGVKALRVKVDLTKIKDVKKFFAVANEKIGMPDLLINNASVFERTPFKTLNDNLFDKIMDANLKSYYLCALEASRYMKKGGRIINVSSLGGIKPYRNYLPYSISKAGVIMLTKCLALELAPKILVNSVAPGILEMPEEKRPRFLPSIEKIPLKKYGNPSEITNFILSLINSEYITGQVFLIDGGKVLN